MKSHLTTITLLLSLFVVHSAFAQSKEEVGIASFYSDKLHHKKTASGELYDKYQLTGAHRTLPFGTIVRVTRLDTEDWVEVTINDRGPFKKGRIVDLSRVAAEQIDLIKDGMTKVRLEVLFEESPSAASSPPVGYPEKVEHVQAPTPATPVSPAPEESKTEAVVAFVQEKVSDVYDLYKVQPLRPEKNGFAVQVATLGNYADAMRKITTLQEIWFDKILLSIEPGKDNETIFKILLGPFPNRETAKRYLDELKSKEHLESFIISLEEIGY